MRVWHQSESMVDTFPPSYSQVAMQGRVVKTPIPSGGYAIRAELRCRSAALCDSLHNRGMNLFNITVKIAGMPFADK